MPTEVIVAVVAAFPATIAAWASYSARHAVTANGHSSRRPTVPDRLANLDASVQRIEARLDRHLAWSQEETTRLWDAVDNRKKRG